MDKDLDSALEEIFYNFGGDCPPSAIDNIRTALLQLIDQEKMKAYEKLEDFASKNDYDPSMVKGYVEAVVVTLNALKQSEGSAR